MRIDRFKQLDRKRKFPMQASIRFVLSISILSCLCPAQTAPPSSTDFPPLEQWKRAVIAGDAASLTALYKPEARVSANGVENSGAADANFWLGLKARSIEIEIVRLKDSPLASSVIFKASIRTAAGQTINVTDAQGWKNDDGHWRIAGAERTDAPPLKQPSDMKKNIYPADADAHAELKEAEKKAASDHKRLILIFGANWCYDCHVLDLALQRPDLAPIVAQGFELVHVDLGDDGKKNADIVRQFDTTTERGVPVLSVAESDGTVVFGQKNGEFEDARSLTPQALLEFLNRWKPKAQ